MPLCQEDVCRKLIKAIDEINPTFIYFHSHYENDSEHMNEKSLEIDSTIENFCPDTCVYVITDTRRNVRWEQRFNRTNLFWNITECRGDLAFYSNYPDFIAPLIEWANADGNGTPKSVDSLSDLDFGDLLAGQA